MPIFPSSAAGARLGRDLALARSRRLVEGSRRLLDARARARVLDLALMARSFRLLDSSRRTLGAMLPETPAPAGAAHVPGAKAQTRPLRCTHLGCEAEAQHRVRFVAMFETHQMVLKRFTLDVCTVHRASLDRLIGDGQMLEAWRRRVEAQGGSASSLRAVRAVSVPLC